jgi:hypothetical protein
MGIRPVTRVSVVGLGWLQTVAPLANERMEGIL